MLLGPGQSVLGPGQSVAHPERSGVIRVDTVYGPGRSVALPWWSVVIRVGSVFIRSAAVLGPGWSGVTMFFDRLSSVEGPSKHFHLGSRHLLVRGYPGWSVLGPALVLLRPNEAWLIVMGNKRCGHTLRPDKILGCIDN